MWYVLNVLQYRCIFFNVPNFYFFSLFFQSSSGQSTYVQSSCCNPWLDSAWWVNSLHRSQNKSPTQSKQHTAIKKSVFIFSPTDKKANNQNKIKHPSQHKNSKTSFTRIAKRPPYHSRGRCRSYTPPAAPGH